MQERATTRVLFVCMGNICRSPTAQGVFEQLLEERGRRAQFQVESAGTHAYHIGEPPDDRSQAAARIRGVDLSMQRARAVHDQDFERFDWIIAMDRENQARLLARCPAKLAQRIHLFMSFAPEAGVEEVPDPYYGGARGFEKVLDLTERAAVGLLQAIDSGAQSAQDN